tara:strand:- start:364 stop:885 length:522 start_codon:yes stop_codon:yes gene_type:complete
MNNNSISFIYKNDCLGCDDIISFDFSNKKFILKCTCNQQQNCWHLKNIIQLLYNDFLNIQSDSTSSSHFIPISNNNILSIYFQDKNSDTMFIIKIILENNHFYFDCSCNNSIKHDTLFQCTHINQLIEKLLNYCNLSTQKLNEEQLMNKISIDKNKISLDMNEISIDMNNLSI